MQKLTTEQLNAFAEEVGRVKAANPSWRLGQTMFNVLYEHYPELANNIRGTEADPFYNNQRIGAFMLAIH
jgi:hypothetical protein